MDSARLVEGLGEQFSRLRAVVAGGADLGRAVPSCPGWVLADLARHVGSTYLHKVECIRRKAHPEPWPPAGLDAEEPLALLDRAHAALSAEFASRRPEDAAFTWYGPDQTVGFWIRRMAQETLIHRVDAELAAGVEVAAVPDDLALDGIDEFLVAFIEYGSHTWPDDFATALATTDGRGALLETSGGAWLVTPTPEGVRVRVSDVDTADAVVSGKPGELLLWAWNRTGGEAVATSGDAGLVADLRTVFAVGAR
jgi:uncharacterized protein (TIGR03083 family)